MLNALGAILRINFAKGISGFDPDPLFHRNCNNASTYLGFDINSPIGLSLSPQR